MILVDTGPLVALFDPRDPHHLRCRKALQGFREVLTTTTPVLTETFHMLSPGSRGARNVRAFVTAGGLSTWFMDHGALDRAFELMERYVDHPMDLADASLLVAAERLDTRRIFTVDRRDFLTYRIRRGHRLSSLEIIS